MTRGATADRPGLLFLIETSGLGGSERAMANIALAAARDGFRVAAGVGGAGWLSEHLTAHGIPVSLFGDISYARKFSTLGLLRLSALARRRRIALMSTFSFQMHVYGCLAGAILRRPCVVNLRNAQGDFATGLRRRLWRHLIARRSQQITAVSAAARDRLLECAPAAQAKTCVVPNGVDLGALLPRRSPREVRRELAIAGGPVIGTVGRLQEVKRHLDLVEAAVRLKERFPDLQLVIAGVPVEPVYSQLKAQVARLGIADSVHLLGDRRDVPDLLQVMDVFVQSSASEGMSNVLLEAMGARRPVVATAVGGTPEVVADGETGLLVPPLQPARLAAAIAELLSDPDRAHRLAEAARVRMEREFSASTMFARHLAIYRSICGLAPEHSLEGGITDAGDQAPQPWYQVDVSPGR